MDEYIFNDSDLEVLNKSMENLCAIAKEIHEALSEAFCEDLFEDITTIAAYIVTVIEPLTNLKETFPKLFEGLKPAAKFLTEIGESFQAFAIPILGIVAAVALLTGGFVYLMETSEEFRTRIEEVFAGLSESFQIIWETNIKPVFDDVVACIQNIWELYLKDLLTNCGLFVASLIEFLSPIIIWLADFTTVVLGPVITWIFDALEGVIGFIVDVVGSVIQILSGIIDFLNVVFTLDFAKALEGLKNILKGVCNFVVSIFTGIVNVVALVCTGVGNAILSVLNGVVSVINILIRGIQKLGLNIDELPRLPQGVSLPTVSIPKLEFGGLVTPGQSFVAREAGPEIVGSFGGYTAVMNNNQIVESVSDGVFRAVRAAMSPDMIANAVYKAHQFTYANAYAAS